MPNKCDYQKCGMSTIRFAVTQRTDDGFITKNYCTRIHVILGVTDDLLAVSAEKGSATFKRVCKTTNSILKQALANLQKEWEKAGCP